jgi:uncharacterized low-complexity protein
MKTVKKLVTTATAAAKSNPFSMTEMDNGYTQVTIAKMKKEAACGYMQATTVKMKKEGACGMFM